MRRPSPLRGSRRLLAFTPGERSASQPGAGFTLIELLVVIAIISILAAILFPVFAKAREKARQSSCASNLKQVGLAVFQYAQDYDEAYPMAYLNGAFNDAPPTWRQVVQPYVKSADVFVCPSNLDNGRTEDGANGSYPAISASYSGNIRVFSYTQTWSRPEAITLGYVKEPSQKILVMERKDGIGVPALSSWPDYHQADKKAEVTRLYFAGHAGMANYLFCDGHVKAMKPTQTMRPINMWGAFYDNTGDGGDCDPGDTAAFLGVNCNQTSAGHLANLSAVEEANR